MPVLRDERREFIFMVSDDDEAFEQDMSDMKVEAAEAGSDMEEEEEKNDI